MTNAKTNKAKAINVTAATESNVQIVLGSISKLAEVRKLYVTAEMKTGEVQKMYALQMCDTFGAGWYDAKGEIGKGVKAEHKQFVADFTEAGKTRGNIDKMWQRIKELSGRPVTPTGNASGGDDTGVDAKTIAELKTVYNRIANSTDDVSPLSYKIKAQLEEILDQLGVEI